LLLAVVTLPADAGWKVAEPAYPWSFPRDHWSHPGYRTEWWYFTGHLEAVDEPGRSFGYQFTIFRVGLTPEPTDLDSAWSAANLVMGHASITDKSEGDHRFSELLYRETDFLGGFGSFPDPRIAWARAPAGTDGKWTLDWNGEGFDLRVEDRAEALAFELSTRPVRPRVFQGPDGYSRKAPDEGIASLYYSFTRMETAGSLELDGARYRVKGSSWMDREFSSSHLGEGQVGWDWFSLNLADGRDLMLYLMRRADGSLDFGRGTVVSPDGGTRYLTPAEWELRVTDRWKSDASGTVYPSGWTIELPGERLRLRVVPVMPNQENIGELAGGLTYWEGAVEVLDATGTVSGRGYVELTGYGERNRPPV
jgi:predicted secreted hydrolase